MSNEYFGGVSIIAKRYALALIELGEENSQLDRFDGDLNVVKQTILENRELSEFLEHPEVSSVDKKEVIEDIFKEHISEIILSTVKLLIDRNRIFILAPLSNTYHKQLNKMNNILEAVVIAAIQLDGETLGRIKQKLEDIYQKTLEISFKVDKEIIAGIVVKVEDKVIDGSIKNRLDKMKNQFI